MPKFAYAAPANPLYKRSERCLDGLPGPVAVMNEQFEEAEHALDLASRGLCTQRSSAVTLRHSIWLARVSEDEKPDD